jgi:hypothetical protein
MIRIYMTNKNRVLVGIAERMMTLENELIRSLRTCTIECPANPSTIQI